MRSFSSRIIFSLLVSFYYHSLFSQGGEWTWVKGSNNAGSNGNYGIKGVPAASNVPPALYGATPWTDLDGNFWIIGGYDNASATHNALWKYDVSTNMWTWLKGSSSPNATAAFGTQGIPDPNNTPGAVGLGSLSWTDSNGDLWLYGGYGSGGGFGALSDLWRYHIATNEWTWMQGSGMAGETPVYGTFQVPAVSNTPGGRWECTAGWIDDDDNLWFYGGWDYSFAPRGDVWKYDVSINQWIWMSGPTGTFAPPDYGTKGVPSPTNQPGGRSTYCSFKDAAGKFWFFGSGQDAGNLRNDLWMFDPATTIWTWMSGTNQLNNAGTAATPCIPDTNNAPSCRQENRARWSDSCGNMWIFGGGRTIGSALNDLWVYRPDQNDWTFVKGTLQVNQPAIYGTQGISDPANMPGARYGSSPFMDVSGNQWLFGGMSYTASPLNDLWKFVRDTTCSALAGCNTIVTAPGFLSSDSDVCQKFCIDFTDQSTNNPTAWQWLFPGGTPSSSTAQNPTQICYQNPGIYDVTLITTNAGGNDTLTFPGFVTVYATPPFPVITQTGNTLTSSNALFYQWQFNSVDVAGATNQSYDIQQSGFYGVVITDENGCTSSSTVYILIEGTADLTADGKIVIYPNPTQGNFVISFSGPVVPAEFEIEITNTLGQIVFYSKIKSSKGSQSSPALFNHEIDLQYVPNGVYYVGLKAKNINYREKLSISR
jgi:hypothetical protein